MQQMHGAGKRTSQILARITTRRNKQDIEAPELQVITRAVRGHSFNRGGTETRGRKRSWTPAQTRKADSARKALYKKADGEEEVHWADIQKRARVPSCHRTTAARSFQRAGLDVGRRNPREKPVRDESVEKERVRLGKRFYRYGDRYFTHTVDGLMDNRKFDITRAAASRRWKNMRKVRFHLRTRKEGLKRGFTKPSARKHRSNPGAAVNVCCLIIRNKIRVFHYLPKKWCAAAAEDLYRGPIIEAFRANLGNKRKFLLIEDNDPTGYKSSRGKAAKKELKIEAIEWPRYSPDLHPLDFSIWQEIENRMAAQKVPKNETIDEYKLRLRRTAMRIPSKVIRKAVSKIPERGRLIALAKGGNIARD